MITVPARALLNGSMSSGVAQISMQPPTFNSVAQVADNYEFYRLTRLRYRLHPNGGGAFCVAAYIAGAVDNAPSTPSDLAVTPHCVVLGDDVQIPTPWRNVPRAALASYNTWYKTIAGSPDPSEEVQGKIYLAGGGTDAYWLEMEATYQFRTLVVTSATPAERGALALEKERAYLLRILGLSNLVLPPTPGIATPSGCKQKA